jgi:GWxTD domain-containing protein
MKSWSFLLVAVLALFVSALAPSAQAKKDKDALVEPPLVSTGDLAFEVDLAGFRAQEGQTEEEIFVDLANDQIAFQNEDGALRGKLKLEIELRNSAGKRAFEKSQTLAPVAVAALDAGDRSVHQVIRQNAILPPGEYQLRVEVTDEKSEKPGLIHMIRKTKKKGLVEGLVRIPDLSQNEMIISDVLFSRDVRVGVQELEYERNGVAIDPNPARQYGMVIPYLSYYAEVYAGNDFQPQDSIFVRTRILDRVGGALWQRQTLARPASNSFVTQDQIDLTRTMKAGSYVLEISARNRRTGLEATSSRPFEVLWAIASWSKDADSLLEEMKLIMRAQEYGELVKLSPGAREVYLAQFWKKLDPDPGTAQNEALQEFQRRVQYADREYSGTIGRGMLTDRGRVYVRYGPPDEVSYQFSSSSFGENENVERVSDPAERVGLSNRPNASYLDPDEYREGDVSDLSTQRGGANIKSKELEVWEYDGPGHSLYGRAAGKDTHRGLKFIFADEMGNGEYELIGSEGTTDF